MIDRAHARDVLKDIGRGSAIATMVVFPNALCSTLVVGGRLCDATSESITRGGELNAKRSAVSFDRYLPAHESTVPLAGNVVNNMLEQGGPNSPAGASFWQATSTSTPIS